MLIYTRHNDHIMIFYDKYKLHEISSAEFSFCLLKTQEIIPISEAAFQLDIVESYGRFQ